MVHKILREACRQRKFFGETVLMQALEVEFEVEPKGTPTNDRLVFRFSREHGALEVQLAKSCEFVQAVASELCGRPIDIWAFSDGPKREGPLDGC